MGCGASSTSGGGPPESPHPEEEEERGTGIEIEMGPDGLQLAAWWTAGEVLPGVMIEDGLVVPNYGPFAPRVVGEATGKVIFGTKGIEVDGKGDGVSDKFSLGDNIYARGFFATSLPSFSVGWSRLELSKDRHHYNTKKVREREQALLEQGRELDYSKRKKYFLYPENIKEIGIFMKADGKTVTSDVAISSDSWGIEPIEGAFFTFAPERGSIYGTQTEKPDASMPLYLRAPEGDPKYTDARWARLQLEFLKALKPLGEGTHTITLEVAYRYGNWKFFAWNDAECKDSSRTPAYRYSDEERDREEEVSAPIAKGQFQMKLSKADVAALPDEIKKLEEVFDTAYKKQTQG